MNPDEQTIEERARAFYMEHKVHKETGNVPSTSELMAAFARSEQERDSRLTEALAAMTDEQRMEIFSAFCRYCGSDNPACQCWNDE